MMSDAQFAQKTDRESQVIVADPEQDNRGDPQIRAARRCISRTVPDAPGDLRTSTADRRGRHLFTGRTVHCADAAQISALAQQLTLHVGGRSWVAIPSRAASAAHTIAPRTRDGASRSGDHAYVSRANGEYRARRRTYYMLSLSPADLGAL
jgi:hypothetical protein